MSTYLQVTISAENKEQADAILDRLLEKKLVAGGFITHGPAKFWWKGKVIGMNYYNISTFSIRKHKKAITAQVKKVSIEEVPMIWFISFEGNKELLIWIDESIG